MSSRTKRWLAVAGIAVAAGIAVLFVTAYALAHRLDPYIREQAVLYLQERFDSEVQLSELRVRLPKISPLKMLLNRGQGTIARVEGQGLIMRYQGRRDIPPMFEMDRFGFEMDLGTVFEDIKTVRLVTVDGMKVNIPPKGDRPRMPGGESGSPSGSNAIIEEVVLTNSVLNILPKDRKKIPLRFDLHNVRLTSAGMRVAMKYEAELTNAKPPGEIYSIGTFGPWSAGEPGDTPLTGDYTFQDADLGVFSGIAGTLNSTGQFEGTLSAINAKGQASVPDFRLKMSGNAVPLETRFEVLVDGTNGDTILQPVHGRLGKTEFTTSGGVIKHDADLRRTISLDVVMPKGNLRDVLTLAMKGSPFMEGQVFLQTTIDIPPLTGKVRERLLLDGNFEVSNAKFLRSKIQNQIDELSRRGQGQPKNMEIDEVVSAMAGTFSMVDETITFKAVSFAVEGAGVDLAGSYDLDRDMLDFRGTLRLRAKVSQTMTGWKRWVLKPIDPFFSKQGAGTLLRIKVDGTAKAPKFGLNREKR